MNAIRGIMNAIRRHMNAIWIMSHHPLPTQSGDYQLERVLPEDKTGLNQHIEL